MERLFYILALLGLSVFFPVRGNTQAATEETGSIRNFDRQEWEEAIAPLDYSQKKKKQNKEAEDDSGERGGGRYQDLLKEGGNARIPMQILLVVLAIIVLAVVIVAFFGLNKPRNRKLDEVGAATLQQIEERLHEVPLEGHIKKAIAAGNYPLAVRLYYLNCLRLLSLQKSISWKKDKTNSEYLRELKEHPLRADFRQLTNVFDQLIYGGAQLDAAQFHAVEPLFQQFTRQLKPATTDE